MGEHDNLASRQDWTFSKYPPGYFGLRELLGPIVRALLEWRFGWDFPERVNDRLFRISMLFIDLIDDDELGLIDATPEDRVRFALSLTGERHE